MATQSTYSLIYTTHKLFSFVVARLCLLVIKRTVPQTALETKALHPPQTETEAAAAPACSLPPQIPSPWQSSEQAFQEKRGSPVSSSFSP